jgi:steroid delta-isomerase
MASEAARKELALEYCARMNRGDLDGVLALFTDDPRFEDPIGSPHVGRPAVRAHLARAIEGRVHEVPGTPVAALDGEHVVLPAVVTVGDPSVPAGKRVRFNLMGLIRVGPDDLIHEVRVLWGTSDVTLVDAD